MEPRINLFRNDLGAKLVRQISGINRIVEQSTLPKATQHLVLLRASQMNGCGWCVDIHAKEAMAAGETRTRLDLLVAWRHATVFTEAERAALELTEQGTHFVGACNGVSDETWAKLTKHYDESEIIALVSMIAIINANNRLSVMLGYQGGSYELGMFEKVAN